MENRIAVIDTNLVLVMKRSIFLIIFNIVGISIVHAQPCNNYSCVINKVKKALFAKDYLTAFNNLESAEGYADKNIKEISNLRKEMFVAIEREKKKHK